MRPQQLYAVFGSQEKVHFSILSDISYTLLQASIDNHQHQQARGSCHPGRMYVSAVQDAARGTCGDK